MVVVYHQAEGQCCTEYLRVQAGRLGQCTQITIEIGTAHEVYNHVHMRNVILTGLLFAMAFLSAAASKDHDTSVDPPPCSPKMRQAIDTMKSQKSRADIAPPVPLVSPEAEFPDSARKQLRKKHTLFADSILGFTVDTEGNPKDVCLIQPAGFGLDESAANAAKGYKFKPARDHGDPIAYPTTLQVSFRLY